VMFLGCPGERRRLRPYGVKERMRNLKFVLILRLQARKT
jgi:hypothetical protein